MYTQSKEFKTRITHKHDVQSNWLQAENKFVPLAGELIIYDADGTYTQPRYKIGNGTDLLGNLPFIDAASVIEELDYTDAPEAGKYVSAVTQANGVIAVTKTALPNKLSDFENDLFYAKKTSFLTLTKSDFQEWVNHNGEIMHTYTGSPKIDWVASEKDIAFTFSATINDESMNDNNESVPFIDFAKEITDDGESVWHYAAGPFVICNGMDFKNLGDAFLSKDEYTISLMIPPEIFESMTDLNIEIFRVDKKIIDYDVLPEHAGKNVTGTEYIINDESVIANDGAEIFNNYKWNRASGYYSHAEGNETTASGDNSHAEGQYTEASGVHSHAEGESTIASGFSSHAEGRDTKASGENSHAEGNDTTASGFSSHAEGSGTKASGEYSHAEGYHTTANSQSQHVQGEYNIRDTENLTGRGTYAHIVGNGTISKHSNAHTLDWAGNAWFASDVYVGSTSGINKDEGSVALMKSVNPTGTGSFSLNRKTNTTIGDYSFAEGRNTTATGYASHAEGSNTTASYNSSHAEGYSTIASGAYSHAEGEQTIASGEASHAEGCETVAFEDYAHAEGYGRPLDVTITGNASAKTYTLATANPQIRAGQIIKYGNKQAKINSYDSTIPSITVNATLSTSNINSVSATIYTHVASGQYSHVEGSSNIASGENSHAEGYNTRATGNYSHAEGSNNTASGSYSHVEGYANTASGSNAHAEGSYTRAIGERSHAEGSGAIAYGDNSHVEGHNTTAKSYCQHVQGEYNVADDTGNNTTRGTYAHIVGNGTNGHPSNAHTLDWSGNAWFSGDVYVGSTYGTEQDEGSKKLATEEYVGNQITANAPNLTNYKTKQTAVSSPTASGSATAFIDTISQDANGKITVTKKNITASALGLDRAMSFLGTTTTALTDGVTINPITINNGSTTAAKGDVVIVSGTDQEFIWTGSAWEEFGNASSHSIKGHTHTVTHKPAGTVDKTSITPAGTVSQPTFSGSAVNSGENTGTNFSAAPGGHKHSVTAAGTVSQPTFTGTEATITISHTPAGTVSQPIFTGTAVTSGKPDTTNVTTIYSITGVGSLPSASLSAGTAPSHTYTAPSLTASIANKCMTFSWSAGSHSFSAGTYPTLTFSAGSLPTRSSAISMPNTNHTHSVTAAGTVSQPTFTGSSVSGSTKYTPAGTVSQPTFTGSAVNSGANTGTNTSVAPAKHKHSVTAAGTVSQPTFTGTAAEHSHTFAGTSATITTSGSSN